MPVGVPVPGLTTATVAVKVTGWPKTDVLFGDEDVSVVVVLSGLTTGDSSKTVPRLLAPPKFVVPKRSPSASRTRAENE